MHPAIRVHPLQSRFHRVVRRAAAQLAWATMLGLSATAQGADVAAYAGTWDFTFSGDDSGGGTAIVAPDGQIHGSGHSTSLDMELELSGNVSADGSMSMEASPAGGASTGASFIGKANGSAAAGSWRNEDAGMGGSWTARRTAAGQSRPARGQQVHCRIDAVEFDAVAPIVADMEILPASAKAISMIRIIASDYRHGPKDIATGATAKAINVTGPGSYELSVAPTWPSEGKLLGKEFKVSRGSLTLTALTPPIDQRPAATPRDTGHAAGKFVFEGGGHRGECSFDLRLVVLDTATLTAGRGGKP